MDHESPVFADLVLVALSARARPPPVGPVSSTPSFPPYFKTASCTRGGFISVTEDQKSRLVPVPDRNKILYGLEIGNIDIKCPIS